MGMASFSIRYGRKAAYYALSDAGGGSIRDLEHRGVPGLAAKGEPAGDVVLRCWSGDQTSELGMSGQQRAIAMIDMETAQLHAAFGYLMVLGLLLAVFLPGLLGR